MPDRTRHLALALVAWLLAPAAAEAGADVWVHPALAATPRPGGLGASTRTRDLRLLHVRDARQLEARRQLDAFARERVLTGESLKTGMRGSPADVAALEARSLEAERRATDRDLAELAAMAARCGWPLGPTTRRVLLESRLALREAERLDEVAHRGEVLGRDVTRRDAGPSLAWPRPGSAR
jgi:hypothetical protein